LERALQETEEIVLPVGVFSIDFGGCTNRSTGISGGNSSYPLVSGL